MFNNKKWGSPSSVLNYKHLKPKLRVFQTGYTISMLTSEVKKINKTYSLIVGYLFDTIIVENGQLFLKTCFGMLIPSSV